MSIKILPWHRASKSAKALQRGLPGSKRLKLTNGEYQGHENDTLINWGCGHVPAQLDLDRMGRVLNWPKNVKQAVSKTKTYAIMNLNGIEAPTWTTALGVAKQWAERGYKVVNRTRDAGRGGAGITVTEPSHTPLRDAKFWTLYVPKDREYRVHTFQGQVLDFTQKLRRRNVSNDPYVCSSSNGWVFCRNAIVQPKQETLDLCVVATAAMGLDFAAIDVFEFDGPFDSMVCEVNTAAGLEGTTLRKYVEAFSQFSA